MSQPVKPETDILAKVLGEQADGETLDANICLPASPTTSNDSLQRSPSLKRESALLIPRKESA